MTPSSERADASRNRRAVLTAAATLLSAAADPASVTIDEIAAAAHVGKGTVFRRFGDRAGLLRALLDERIAALVDAVSTGPEPLGPTTPAAERARALLDAVVLFKLTNRAVLVALELGEQRAPAAGFYASPNYRWTHHLLSGLLEAAGHSDSEATGHALLTLTRIDYLDELSAQIGHSTLVRGLVATQMSRLLDLPDR